MNANVSEAELGREMVAGNDVGDLDSDQAMEGLVDHGKDFGFDSK